MAVSQEGHHAPILEEGEESLELLLRADRVLELNNSPVTADDLIYTTVNDRSS
jgi:hypothetical protein